MKKGKPEVNPLKVILFGLLFSIAASLIWFGAVVISGWQLGIVAIGVGYIIGLGITKGAEGKTGIKLQVMSALFALFAMVLAEYLITNHFVYKFILEETQELSSYFLPATLIFQTMVEMVKEDLLTLLFWAIGIYAAFTVPKDRKIQI